MYSYLYTMENVNKKKQKHGCLYKDIFAEARFCKKLQLRLVMWNMNLLFSGVRGYSLGGVGVCTSLSDRFYMVFDTLNSVKACWPLVKFLLFCRQWGNAEMAFAWHINQPISCIYKQSKIKSIRIK